MAATVIESKKFVKPNETFRGLSYGEIIVAWTNWLMGDRPDYYDGGDILFLRGNVGYYDDRNTFYDRGDIRVFRSDTGSVVGNGLKIRKDTAILIPIVTAQFDIGGNYSGARIEDETSLRRAVRDDLNSGGEMWATVCKIEGEDKKKYLASRLVDDNLENYRAESPRFKMLVTEQNPFRKTMEVPKDAGVYDAVTGGFFILIKGLDAGRYVIRFGAKGRGNYYTDAVYDITVEGTRLKTVKDISDNPKRLPAEIYEEIKIESSTQVFLKVPKT
jgi:hypothetical protein